jgi:hypothetical protein
MKSIIHFEIVDMGIQAGMGTPKLRLYNEMIECHFNGWASGVGTDAESALDDLFHILQEADYDVTGLESQIKERWEPSTDEGDGHSFYYHFGLVFRFTRS